MKNGFVSSVTYMRTRFEQEYRLKALDVDMNGLWMPSAIFVRMQEVAEEHAEIVQLGRTQIIERGLAWAVTRMHLQMEHYPSLGETIRVSTWPLKPHSLMVRRQFLFEYPDGRVLGRASSQWIILDLRERTMKRISTLGGYPHDPEAQSILSDPRKIMLPPDMELVQVRRVQYSDVDMNAHMNNSKYLNWMCDLYPVEFLKHMRLREVYISYIGEAHIGEDVSLYMEQDGEEDYYVRGKSPDKTIFDAQISWGSSKEHTIWRRKSEF